MPVAKNKVWTMEANGAQFSANCKPTRGLLAMIEGRKFANRDRSAEYFAKVQQYVAAGDSNKAGLWAADLVSLMTKATL